MALPGDGGIATRKVAVLVADGVDAASVAGIQAALTKEGAVTRLLGGRLGTFRGFDGLRSRSMGRSRIHRRYCLTE